MYLGIDVNCPVFLSHFN